SPSQSPLSPYTTLFRSRPYQASDSPRHMAWKASARSELLLTKLFAGRAASELWFDWDGLPAGMHTEARLSRLARWVMLAEERGRSEEHTSELQVTRSSR